MTSQTEKRAFAISEGFRVGTPDELSRGSAYWGKQIARLQRKFSNTVGDDNLQRVANLIHQARIIREDCISYGPCSRVMFLDAA
jgi:hypothetical protein